MKRALILVISVVCLSACDQMGGSRGDSGGMGSQTDKAFDRGSGSVQKGPKDTDYRSGESASEPGQRERTSNPGSPSGGTAGRPDKQEGNATDNRQAPR